MEAETVSMEHFEKALGKARPSVDEDTIKFYEAIGKEMEGGIAKRDYGKPAGETGYA